VTRKHHERLLSQTKKKGKDAAKCIQHATPRPPLDQAIRLAEAAKKSTLELENATVQEKAVIKNFNGSQKEILMKHNMEY
jgi:hypothetical protein